jgi:hypothetical protein
VQSWVDDSASQVCLLCVERFTMSNRRHHCRACGALVCDQCSSKRLNTTKSKPAAGSGAAARGGGGSLKKSGSSGGLFGSSNALPAPGSASAATSSSAGTTTSTSPSSPPPPPPPAPTGKPGKPPVQTGDRVCDGCFNKLSLECVLWQQAMAKVRRNQEKLAAENPELLTAEANATGSSSAMSMPAAMVGKVMNVAMQTRRALELRGERLEQVAERSEELRQVEILHCYFVCKIYVLSLWGLYIVNDVTFCSAFVC